MRILRRREIVDDPWVRVDTTGPLPDCDVIVPLERWLRERDALLARGCRLGVQLHGEHDVALIADDLHRLSVVALEFPYFRDGRCYTHARLLREQFGFRGEIRAVGDVMRDQLRFMERCGIDAFELKSGKSLDDALRGFAELSHTYQAAADEPLPHYNRA